MLNPRRASGHPSSSYTTLADPACLHRALAGSGTPWHACWWTTTTSQVCLGCGMADLTIWTASPCVLPDLVPLPPAGASPPIRPVCCEDHVLTSTPAMSRHFTDYLGDEWLHGSSVLPVREQQLALRLHPLQLDQQVQPLHRRCRPADRPATAASLTMLCKTAVQTACQTWHHCSGLTGLIDG